MSNPSSSPQRHSFRINSLRGFLPLSEDTLSTRGQNLPAILQRRSVTNLEDLRGADASPRRRSYLNGPSATTDNNDSSSDFGGDGTSFLSVRDLCAGFANLGTTPQRRNSLLGADVLQTPQMRSLRLIGNSNPRYRWEQYYKGEEELKGMKKATRKYYERNNFLITQYLYIDRLLDSSLPHDLIQEYRHPSEPAIPQTICEEGVSSPSSAEAREEGKGYGGTNGTTKRVKRTPKDLYHVPQEDTPLLGDDAADGPKAIDVETGGGDEGVDSSSPIVTVAIYINLAANAILLAGKIVVIVLTSSLSVLASLVDAALDFLSTAIVWVTTKLIARQDSYAYPVGRRRLEPVGVLVFSVVMITSFFQVALECFNRLTSGDHSIVQLGTPAIVIMAMTVVIKAGCWVWCRLIKNSSVQALAQDAMTDVVFNIFSIIFPLSQFSSPLRSFSYLNLVKKVQNRCIVCVPLTPQPRHFFANAPSPVGYYARIWWLDALGGLLLSFYVIFNWSRTSGQHIRNLTGFVASADERNILLYLTMRFAKTIHSIQGLQAYHVGDKLNVEVDIVLDENMQLRDSHDLGESLQYVLESVPSVDRAFVHLDYDASNLPGHLEQQCG